jgi:hypothetical protein
LNFELERRTDFMVNKKTLPVVAVLLLLAGAIAIGLGARQEQGIRVPPGEIVESPNARAASQNQEARTPQAPDLPASSEKTLFQDSFDTTLSGWTLVNIAESPANWVSHEGRLEIWGDQQMGGPTNEPSVLANPSAAMTDGTFQAYVYPTAGEPVGLVFRGSDAGYYRLDLYPKLAGNTGPMAALFRVDGLQGDGTRGEEIAAASTYPGYEFSEWQLVSVTAIGDRFTAQVDGQTVLEATDSTFDSGWAGVWTITGYGAQFDNARLLASSR